MPNLNNLLVVSVLLLASAPCALAQVDTSTVVLTCVPDSGLTASQAPCPSSPVSEIVAVPDAVLLSSSDYSAIFSETQPVDYADAEDDFAYFLSLIVGGFAIAMGGGFLFAVLAGASG